MFEGLDIGEIAVIITLVAGIAKFWRVPKCLDALEQGHKEVMTKIDEMNASLGKRIANLGGRIDEVNPNLGERIDEVNASLGKRIDDLGGRIDEVNASLGKRIDDLGGRIDEVNSRIDGLHNQVTNLYSLLPSIK